MRARAGLVAGTAMALCALGCDTWPIGLGPFEGRFSYEARDSLGRPVAIGTLVLAVRADSSVTGSWQFSLVPGADSSAARWHAQGTGTLAGTIRDGEASLNLDPGVADANHVLQVRVVRGGLGGTWGFDGFIVGSPGTVGAFTARAK